MKPLAGKTALVTGGSRGIGAAIARQLAADGATVAISYQKNPDAAAKVVAEIKTGGGRAHAWQADAASSQAVRALVKNVVAEFGGLDILVNNAGVFEGGTLDQVDEGQIDRIIAVNIKGLIVATQAAAAAMKSGGRIIHVGSAVADRVPFPGMSVYAMSKFAVAGLARGQARDLGERGILVNAVQPGPILTDMVHPDMEPMLVQPLAIKRLGKPEEVAAVVAFLAGPGATYCTGSTYNVDGGFAA